MVYQNRYAAAYVQPHGIRTVFRSDTTLRKQLVHPKDKAPPQRKDAVIYSIPCKDCDKEYIGETSRPIAERITEHRRDCRLQRVDSSAVAEHAWGEQHQPDWQGVTCLTQEKHWYARRVKEAITIRLHPQNINRDNGLEIPEFWYKTIEQLQTAHHTHRKQGRNNGATHEQTARTGTANHSPPQLRAGQDELRTDDPTGAANHGRRIRGSAQSGPTNDNPPSHRITQPALGNSAYNAENNSLGNSAYNAENNV